MRILSVSDQVEPMLYEPGCQKSLPGVDLILSCGDLPPDYLTYLMTVFNVPLLYVSGNHDGQYDYNPPQGCVDMHGKIVVYKGIRIMGFEGCHWYNGGKFQYTEKQMARIVFKTKFKIWWHKGIDIVISHAPPRHVHDAKDSCHKGFKCFGSFIDKYSPQLFLHGHIHTSFKNQEKRKTTINKTDVINTFGYYMFEHK
ncbi:MAG: metallophosphoesterase [Deltaproteobacteria bacterium]|nr:metallophosphoesterase [Deltaproteobacteria bacterium]